MARVARHHHFDAFVVSVCVVNSIIVGVQIEMEAAGNEALFGLMLAEQVCTLIFVAELAIRALGLRRLLFSEEFRLWTIFDLIIVVMSLVDLYFFYMLPDDKGEFVDKIATVGPVVKILRVVRILRVFRMLRFLASIRVMFTLIMSSMGALFWLFVLLAFLTYGFGIVLTHAASSWRLETRSSLGADDPRVIRMSYHFGSVLGTMYTLFISFTGGISWGEPAALIQETGYHNFFFYVFFMFFVLFSVVNIVTGVFVEQSIEQARGDHSVRQMKTEEARKAYLKDLHELLLHLDADGDNLITTGEWAEAMQQESVRQLLTAIGIKTTDSLELFEMLDVNRDGSLTVEELVAGFRSFQGNARSIDMHAALRMLHAVHEQNLQVANHVGLFSEPRPSR